MAVAQLWTYNGETLTGKQWAVKLGKGYGCVIDAFKRKGIDQSMADWEKWRLANLKNGRGSNKFTAKKPAKSTIKCLCVCPKCRKERKQPSTFTCQLSPPPIINRVYCKECRGAAGRMSSSISTAGVPI